MRVGTSCAAMLGALIAVACSSSTNPPTSMKRVAPDTLCFKGVLVPGSIVAGDLSPTNGCVALDLFTGDSTLTDVFALPVQLGHGYIVTMFGTGNNPGFVGRLELATDTSDSKQAPDSLLAIGNAPYLDQAFILLAGGADTTYAIRVTTADAQPGDTGAYSIALQSCKMPLPPITDSVTHTDTLTSGDCQLQRSPLDSTFIEVIHVYLLHSSGPNQQREISFHSSAPVRMTVSGPAPAAYGQIPFSYETTFDTATTFDAFVVGEPPQGNLTLVIGTPAQGLVQYTLTVGSEHPSAERLKPGGLRSLTVDGVRPRASQVGPTRAASKQRLDLLNR